jgi:hypothetical protein
MNGSGLDCRIICDATPKSVRQAEGAYLLLFALTLVCQQKYHLDAPITYLFLRCCVTVVFLAIGCRKLEENCACILARTLPKTVVGACWLWPVSRGPVLTCVQLRLK